MGRYGRSQHKAILAVHRRGVMWRSMSGFEDTDLRGFKRIEDGEGLGTNVTI